MNKIQKHTSPPRAAGGRLLAGATLALGGLLAFGGNVQANELNALVWCDHVDADLIQPFEQEHDVTVNTREYEGTGTALAMLQQSRPGDWDVFVVDSTDVRRVVEAGILAELNPDDFPVADFFEGLDAEELHTVDGRWYAVPEKFGYSTVAFDRDRVDVEDMRNVDVVWDPKYQDRIAVYDYYLPVISQTAVALGLDPRDLSEDDLPALREKLFDLKDNIAMVADIVSAQTALATGEVDILFAGAEFAVSGLADDRPSLDWVVPDEGGARWQQAIGVLADSERHDLAVKFVQHVISPEGQAALATSSCFWGMPANMQAALTEEQKKTLRWDEQPEFLKRSYTAPVHTEKFDEMLHDIWAEFLAR